MKPKGTHRMSPSDDESECKEVHLTHERTTVALNSDSRRPHKRTGRPSAYRRDYCNVVLALGLQGASLTQMAVALDVHRATLYRWM